MTGDVTARDRQRLVSARRICNGQHYRPLQAEAARFMMSIAGAFTLVVPFLTDWRWGLLPLLGLPFLWWLNSRVQRFYWLRDFAAWRSEVKRAAEADLEALGSGPRRAPGAP